MPAARATSGAPEASGSTGSDRTTRPDQSSRPTFYVTTPIYYPSGKLHIGHAYTTVAADFIARYKRLCGFDTWFLTGTDEHGLKMERAAKRAGLSPKEFVDRAHNEITQLWRDLEISYDDFIRTTDLRHERVVQEVFGRLHRQGDIYKGTYEGWYCADCESFFLGRQLVEGKCPDCGRQVELVKEEAYFFRLSCYQDRLLEHIDRHPGFIQPVSRRNEMVNFIRSGLDDLCVSRTSFTWGIPVPFDPQHVVYVWIDALINYVSALGYGETGGKFGKFWPADLHLMAKEIVRFHSVIWPIILMALDLPLPKQVFGHGWLTLGGDKISKSRGNVIDPVALVKKYGLDAVRYFLLRELPFSADGTYSEEALVRRVNAELANDIGNLLSRTLVMVERFAQGRVPEPAADDGERPLARAAKEAYGAYAACLDRLELSNALGAVLELVKRANKYIEEQSPWDLAKVEGQRPRLDTVLYDLLETLRVSAVLLSPALTRAPAEILRQLGQDEPAAGLCLPAAAAFGQLRPGQSVRRGAALFPRIEDLPAAAAGPGPAAKAQIAARKPEIVSYDEFARLELRVARVLRAEAVPRADRLLRLVVQLEGEERQLVAGIAAHYEPAALVGRDVVMVVNLEPATIRGVRSQGMILAASAEGSLCLVVPERPMPPGSRVK